MAFTSITVGQVNADSPINETLMDLIRTNLDDLNSRVQSVPANVLVKGWVNFNGTGIVAIRDSYNVVSVTDNGTGDYTVTWDTDFANANYCTVVQHGNQAGGGGSYINGVRYDAVDKTVGAFRFRTGWYAAQIDPECVDVMAIGDQ